MFDGTKSKSEHVEILWLSFDNSNCIWDSTETLFAFTKHVACVKFLVGIDQYDEAIPKSICWSFALNSELKRIISVKVKKVTKWRCVYFKKFFLPPLVSIPLILSSVLFHIASKHFLVRSRVLAYPFERPIRFVRDNRIRLVSICERVNVQSKNNFKWNTKNQSTHIGRVNDQHVCFIRIVNIQCELGNCRLRVENRKQESSFEHFVVLSRQLKLNQIHIRLADRWWYCRMIGNTGL
jgi:hypothetical protein